ncbi:MAG: NAD-dependent epimerase/dehydratase family protein [Pseudomonadota bacterium]
MTLHNSKNKKLVLFLGYGYTARFISEEIIAQKWSYIIRPTRKSNHMKKQLFQDVFARLGLAPKPHYSRLSQQDMMGSLMSISDKPIAPPLLLNKPKHIKNYEDVIQDMIPKVTHILITAPPGDQSDPAFMLYSDLFLEKKCPLLEWVGYLSSTSVYGNLDGAECDETTPVNPNSKRGANRAYAENIWMSLYHKMDIPVQIFRLGGIYGPERNNINDIVNAKAISIIKEGQLNNRIYVKDIAKSIMASMQTPTPGEIYNLVDDMPASRAAVNDYLAFMLDKPAPKKILYDDYKKHLSDMQKSFYEATRIVKNDKIKKMLGVTFQYPSYREGYADIITQNITANDNSEPSVN